MSTKEIKIEEMDYRDYLDIIKEFINGEMKTCPDKIRYISMNKYLEYIKGVIMAYRYFVIRTEPSGAIYEYDIMTKGFIENYREFLLNRVVS